LNNSGQIGRSNICHWQQRYIPLNLSKIPVQLLVLCACDSIVGGKWRSTGITTSLVGGGGVEYAVAVNPRCVK